MTHASVCPFCEAGRQGKFLATSGPFGVLLDRHPVSPGHFLLVPKRHIIHRLEFDLEEHAQFFRACEEAVRWLRLTNVRPLYEVYLQEPPISPTSHQYVQAALDNPNINQKPWAYNEGFNLGEDAGQTVDHLHYHIIPRYLGDMNDPLGGIRYALPWMGNYRRSPGTREVYERPAAVLPLCADDDLEHDVRESRDIRRGSADLQRGKPPI